MISGNDFISLDLSFAICKTGIPGLILSTDQGYSETVGDDSSGRDLESEMNIPEVRIMITRIFFSSQTH